ncbi:sulfotransferase [Microbaculum marinisediminis]|uniref:Sulfotransferase n=1 Tax=Microbaculum marinisediminis TaxID=2931392 RepID=A0AAW5QYP6_9HYPH|nr:sulfotransferase [Microbaculum sp. A6E488]MCT8972029.1 sulfotransferase [Microbaculum sp. A6E488]
MKIRLAWRRARNLVRPNRLDPLRINAVNNPAYSSTVVDADSGRRSVMGTGRKDACAVIRESSLKPGAPRTAIVLGVARGGTSMVSGVLRGLGLFMGDNLGFNHEDSTVQAIVSKKNFGDFGKLARERDGEHRIWGFKFPEASQMMDRFHPSLRNPHYLFVMRHPMARGMSVVARTGGTLPAAIKDALTNYQAIFSFIDQVDAPVLMINYEQATENPRACVEQVARFLGLEAEPETIERAASMILDQGAGYLNLPEYWFGAEEASAPAESGLKPVDAAAGRPKKGEIGYAGDRASVWLAPETGFPKTFWLRFTLSRTGDDDRVRLYYDYDGRFHLGHRLLMDLTSRSPVLKIQTTGSLKRLAIVPLAKDGTVEDVRIDVEA